MEPSAGSLPRLRQYSSSEVVPEYVDIRMVHPSPFNSRTKLEGIDTLVSSIRKNGLLQPIVVRIIEGGFEVVAGHRRLESCRLLRWVRIPCIVKELSDQEAYEIGLVENMERRSLSPVEEARAFERYVKEWGWGSARELAEKLGRSEEYVSHRIALLSLPADVLELIESDKITPSAAHELVWMKDPGAQSAFVAAMGGRKLPAKKVRMAVRLIRGGSRVEEVLNTLSPSQGANGQKSRYARLLERSILSLRICVVRLDSIIEELDSSDEPTLRQVLLRKRLQIHNEIDELLQMKRSAN